MPTTLPTWAARGAAATALLLAVTACTDNSPATPSAPSASSPSVRQQTPTRPTSTASSDRNTAMDIRLTLDGQPVDATLDDNAVARDFASLLPLSLDLEDFHQTERIAYLPRKLDTSGAPAPAAPKAGDLTYYAPWGNMALFYRDGDSASADLIILGHVDDSDTQRLADAKHITIEAAP
ncbi:cyclophilin-like fold protein [Streptomyces sp. NBC_00487]|uniref:cyclophilin-like fold protein n=1 Tax=unclassified Streptomyces TaxID=2593676 RepID=UPI002E180BF4|nr:MULTISPECIES: cyclophilin-like fold protein [unclassified Streptomyces]